MEEKPEMVKVDESLVPKFAAAVRGYDRLQVDDYVERLNQWIEQADNRARQAEAKAARAVADVKRMRRRLAAVDAGSTTSTPESMKRLGDRVGDILRSSFETAEQARQRAEEAARAVIAEAEERTSGIMARATEHAEELSRAAEQLLDEAQQAFVTAEEEAGRRREELLAQAKAEADEVIRKAREEAKAQRDELARMDAQRSEVLTEISLLHERLGNISSALGGSAGAVPLGAEPARAVDEDSSPTTVMEVVAPPDHDMTTTVPSDNGSVTAGR